MKKSTKQCPICKREISCNNYEKHCKCCSIEKIEIENRRKIISEKYKNRSSLNCEYCNKECKNINSLMNHERTCKYNPYRQKTAFCDNNKIMLLKRQKGYINGAMKAKLEGREWIVSEETRKKISEQMIKNNPSMKKENRDKIRNTVLTKVKEGSWHFKNSLYHNIKKYDYNGIILLGNYEYQYAQYLDKNNIKWIRPTETFEYNWNGKVHKYLPDFYLIESKEYVEIKGIETARDRAKWSQFPKKLKVLKRKELRKLGIKV